MAATELLKLEALPAAGGDGRRVQSAATGAWLGRGGGEGEQLRSLAACDWQQRTVGESDGEQGRQICAGAAGGGVVFFLLFLQKNCIAKTFYGTVFFSFSECKKFYKTFTPIF